MRLSAALFLLLACSAFAAEEKTLALREDSDGKSFTLTDEKVVMILLKGNPTTGYSWFVKEVEGKAVAQDGEVVYQKDDPATPRPGQGGVFAASFRPKNAGKSTIHMEYKRPWEKGKEPAKTFTVTIEVPK